MANRKLNKTDNSKNTITITTYSNAYPCQVKHYFNTSCFTKLFTTPLVSRVPQQCLPFPWTGVSFDSGNVELFEAFRRQYAGITDTSARVYELVSKEVRKSGMCLAQTRGNSPPLNSCNLHSMVWRFHFPGAVQWPIDQVGMLVWQSRRETLVMVTIFRQQDYINPKVDTLFIRPV